MAIYPMVPPLGHEPVSLRENRSDHDFHHYCRGSMALDSRFETLYTRLLEKHSGSHLDAASKAYFQHQFTETEKLTFNPVNKGGGSALYQC